MNNDKTASYSCIHGVSKDTSQLQFILKLILPSLWKTGTIFHPGWWVDDKGIPDVSGIRIKNINLLISACSVLFWGQHKEKNNKDTETKAAWACCLLFLLFSENMKTSIIPLSRSCRFNVRGREKKSLFTDERALGVIIRFLLLFFYQKLSILIDIDTYSSPLSHHLHNGKNEEHAVTGQYIRYTCSTER